MGKPTDQGKMNDDKLRREFARAIMRDVAINNRGDELVANPDGTKPVIFALEHELLSAVMHRVTLAGDCANLFVRTDDDRVLFAHMSPPSSETDDQPHDQYEPDDIHQDASIGMFMDTMIATGRSARIAVRLRTQSADLHDVRELLSKR